METTRTTYSDPSIHHMDLPVTLLDGGVRVGAGEVVFEGKRFEMPEETVSIPSRPYPTVVFGYLVIEKATGKMVLFLDEHVQDGIDEAYTFEREGPYTLFAYLFHFVVPPNTTDLRSLDFNRWRIIPKE